MSDKSNKCEHHYDGLCMCNPILNDDGVLLGYEECNKISNRCIRLTGQLLQAKHAELRNKHDKEKLDSELQQLKAENEELKKKKEENTTFYLKKYANKDSECLELQHKVNILKQCLDEIEKICKENYYDDSWAKLTLKLDAILQKIKQVKEGNNGN